MLIIILNSDKLWSSYLILSLPNTQAILVHHCHFLGNLKYTGIHIYIELFHNIPQFMEISDLPIFEALWHDEEPLPNIDLRGR